MTSILEEGFRAALRKSKTEREAQAAKQLASGKADAGTRGSVTGGKHLYALAAAIGDVFVHYGLPRESIKDRGAELPGFYRSTKNWDLVVVHRGILVAAIEMKSQAGSVGNNFNNRAEESIGNAIDLRRAYDAGLLGRVPPWLGYVFVLEDSPKTSRPIRVARTPFSTDETYAMTSYRDRYQILCRRLLGEGLYDTACFAATSRDPESEVLHPDPALSFALNAAIAARVAFVKNLLADG